MLNEWIVSGLLALGTQCSEWILGRAKARAPPRKAGAGRGPSPESWPADSGKQTAVAVGPAIMAPGWPRPLLQILVLGLGLVLIRAAAGEQAPGMLGSEDGEPRTLGRSGMEFECLEI